VPAYLFILVLLAVLWLFLIRPRQRQMKAQQQQLSALQVDDEILTAGGLYGRVKAIEGDEIHVEVAPGVTVRMARRAVAAVLTDHAAGELEASEPDQEGDATLPGT
jgi:preprotein translocase subunit YajC